ncbi:MAG: 50S ribosomal protein L11 methyltransferase [Thermodesulfobacteriota bacterium]
MEPYAEFRLKTSRILLRTPDGNDIFIDISPGSSFGAEHTTTRLCIRGIGEIFREGGINKVLDFGCGSGVLSLCAAALGAKEVLGIDIDPIAVKESMFNSEINKLNSKMRLQQASIEDIDGKFDLIVANIVTYDLLKYLEVIKSVLDKNGILLVSGISELNKEMAISGFCSAGFRLHKEFFEGGWVAIWFDYISQ